MIWNSMSDFLHMGGYGLYVWVSFAITFGCMAIELFLLRARRISNEKLNNQNTLVKDLL
jgi:heme exporter protein D